MGLPPNEQELLSIFRSKDFNGKKPYRRDGQAPLIHETLSGLLNGPKTWAESSSAFACPPCKGDCETRGDWYYAVEGGKKVNVRI